MTEGEAIYELIARWTQYAAERRSYSVREFSEWLYRHEQRADELKGELSTEEVRRQKYMRVGFLFGRLVNFIELWAKLAFKELPIRQFEDYTILYEVRKQKNPAKNELANLLVNEKSTAFEIIKRLIREGLLEEQLDTADRRIRRVSLTQQGQRVVAQASEQAYKVAQLLVGHATEEEVDDILRRFAELNVFHTNLYHNGDYNSIDDLL